MSPASTCLSLRCGVLWSEGQFTLDCRECGGFAADRPCVDCDGHCGQVWRRDVPTVSKHIWSVQIYTELVKKMSPKLRDPAPRARFPDRKPNSELICYIPGDDDKRDLERENWPFRVMLPILPIQSISGSHLSSSPGTASLSHLRTMLPKSSSCPKPAQRPNHAT